MGVYESKACTWKISHRFQFIVNFHSAHPNYPLHLLQIGAAWIAANVKSQCCMFWIHSWGWWTTIPMVENIAWIQSQFLYEVCHNIQTYLASTSSPRVPSHALVYFFHPPYLLINSVKTTENCIFVKSCISSWNVCLSITLNVTRTFNTY